MDLLTIADVAALLGVTPTRVRQWIAAGRLRAIRLGREYAILPRDAVRPEKKPMGRPRKIA